MNTDIYEILKKPSQELSIIQLFMLLGEIKNAKQRPVKGPLNTSNDKDYDMPPIVVWEYTSVSDQSIQFITDLINNYKWKDEWILEKIKNNKWAFYPKRVAEIQLKYNYQYMDKAYSWLNNNDPEFGQRTNADLELFVEYFKNKLEKYLKEKEDKNNGEKYSE